MAYQVRRGQFPDFPRDPFTSVIPFLVRVICQDLPAFSAFYQNNMSPFSISFTILEVLVILSSLLLLVFIITDTRWINTSLNIMCSMVSHFSDQRARGLRVHSETKNNHQKWRETANIPRKINNSCEDGDRQRTDVIVSYGVTRSGVGVKHGVWRERKN